MEKPFALDARQTREILALAAAHQRLVSVNYLYNYETPYLELMEQVRQGALGRAVHLDVVYGYNLGGDYGMAVLADPGHWVHRLPGKLFHNVLDHVLAKAAPFLADVPMHAQAQVRRLRPASGNDALDAMPDELSFQVQAGELGISGMVSAHVRPVQHSLRVYGTKNSFALDIGARTFVPLAAQTLPSSAGRLFPAWRQAGHFRRNAWANARRFWRHEFHFFQGMRVLLTEFYGAIAEQAPEPLPPAIIQRTADVMDAVLESIGRASQRAGS
jgi:predicted dehydrogenase